MTRILVIANETIESSILHETILARAGAEVLIVAPALNSRLRHWLSDDTEARRAAEERLGRSLERLTADGIDASGRIGDADPLQAIDDALHLFRADEIAIATHPEGRSNWLARNLVTRARLRFARPVVHIVVDSARSREYLAA